ncbi:MAG TPA: hypothetical protein VFK05_00180 [Polyangiaceae bacterium]|nr:hypothetical protein [Polyangiaceae bacterium]
MPFYQCSDVWLVFLLVSEVYKAIAGVVRQELATGDVSLGIAGGSRGGDLIFHQVCSDFGIRTELFLPLPEAEFSKRYVAPAGTEWVERFRRVRRSETVRIRRSETVVHAFEKSVTARGGAFDDACKKTRTLCSIGHEPTVMTQC